MLRSDPKGHPDPERSEGEGSRLVLFAAALFLLSACAKEDNEPIAKAGQVKITRKDLMAEIDNVPDIYRTYLSTLEGKKQLLEILLRERILINFAERSGVVRKKEIQETLKNIRQRNQEQENEYRKGLILKEYLRELRDKDLKVEEAEIKKYYEDHKEDFKKPIKVTGKHILSPSEAEAQAVLKRLKSGQDFEKVARENSIDPSADRGGTILNENGMPEIGKGDAAIAELPEFQSALFGLKAGQLSGVIKTKLGYHIIKKTGEMKLPEQPYEQAANQIHRILEKEKFDKWMENKEKKIWIDEKALAALPVQKADKALEGRDETRPAPGGFAVRSEEQTKQ